MLEINRIEEQLKNLPKGKLSCTKNGKYVKWYYTHKKVRKYIPKQDEEFARLLAKRKYLTELKNDLQKERNLLLGLVNSKPDSFRAHLKLLESDGYAGLKSQNQKSRIKVGRE